MIDFAKWREPKPFGFSGCFRLRNESQFMIQAIKSFLPYLDEAVLCVQPSEDNTVEMAYLLADLYPKVKVYKYPYIVDWIDTPGFYSKDTEQPGHLVHMSNYALSKCSYSWIVKVEGDVIALSTMQKIIDKVKANPDITHYYGFVILNLAGEDMDKFSKENPRNGGFDEAIFNNDSECYRFIRRSKWETVTIHDHTCEGWAGVHLKRCKAGKDRGWNGETYLPLTRETLARALDEYNHTKQPYPGKDNPHGIDELFTGEWRQWLK